MAQSLLSVEEKEVAVKIMQYNEDVTALLRNPILVENSLENDIQQLMNLPERQDALRVLLFSTPETEREPSYQQFLQDQMKVIQTTLEKYTPTQNFAGPITPLNQQGGSLTSANTDRKRIGTTNTPAQNSHKRSCNP